MLILGSDSENEDDGWLEGLVICKIALEIFEKMRRDEMACVNDGDDREIVYVCFWRGIFKKTKRGWWRTRLKGKLRSGK